MPNALVTGAGSGIGQAIAARLVREGFRVWVSDLEPIRAEQVGKALGMPHLAVDVTSRSALEEAARHIFASDHRLDVLVANAGVSTMNPFLELSEEEWDFNFAVNAKGTFLTLQTFARQMAQQPLMTGREVRGKLIATASMAARQAAPLLAHYSASKFAVLGLVQAIAKELAPLQLTVNAVNPGFVQTQMQEREVAWEARLRGLSPQAVLKDYVRQTPLGRLQRPEDVAAAVAFLVGPDSDFITGEAMEVNGGAWIF
ncbi:SDR family NAD(P)-dependent oxidoreductase [Meiothermus sp.]|uniref:SDR family NAD(P)-dependent oxidoreductase n=1 Tax=Meiothermus sp. TaxID=1955249 RepID=UPI0021DE433A|nr:SDR family NAD(P)-dependent oxidoreductase [Meiothermus sp.]GIW35215.1 MAG: 3-ketoacyl-ACP reductase [Meiothermus sp.]